MTACGWNRPRALGMGGRFCFFPHGKTSDKPLAIGRKVSYNKSVFFTVKQKEWSPQIMMNFTSHSAADTEAIGARFARMLRPGDIVAFRGGMGAGKTAFTRGMASVLAPDAEVASPTFALVNDYGGKVPFWHFDMFRITSADDLYSTGFFDYLEMGGIIAVEWSENIEGALPDRTIYVDIQITGEEDRVITIGSKKKGSDGER